MPFNPFLHIVAFWRLFSRKLLKTVWQKEKMLIMSNFCFCHTVFNFLSVLKQKLVDRDFLYFWEDVSTFLWRFFSRLLQICCMWERVKAIVGSWKLTVSTSCSDTLTYMYHPLGLTCLNPLQYADTFWEFDGSAANDFWILDQQLLLLLLFSSTLSNKNTFIFWIFQCIYQAV